MRNGQDNWEFVSVLPNLICKEQFVTNYAAIVQAEDPRVKAIRAKYKSVDKLIDSFVDNQLNKVSPSVLIIRKELCNKEISHSSIVAFRNIVALSVILKSWIPIVGNKEYNVSSTLYSDYYDIFPCGGYSETVYSVTTPSVNIIISNIEIKYQQSYSLPNTKHFLFFLDDDFFYMLIFIWEKYFIFKSSEKSYESLFRSLQMAYSACKMPTDNYSTLYDYGTKLGLWISAFEILFHKTTKDDIRYWDIINELNKFDFTDENVRNKTYKINKNTESNVVGKVYKELHDARNEFFHGNTISKKHLYLFKNEKFPALTHIAPIIYLIALKVFLKNTSEPRHKSSKSHDKEMADCIGRMYIEDIFVDIISQQ